MFTKIGGKAYGYATLLAVLFFSLAACGPGPGTEDGGTDGSVDGGDGGKTDAGDGGDINPTIAVTTLTSSDVKDTSATLSGTVTSTGVASVAIACTCTAGTKDASITPNQAAFAASLDGLENDVDYSCTATPLDSTGKKGTAKTVTFHTAKTTVIDPAWELAKTVFNGSTWRVADSNDQNTNPIQTTQLSETDDPSCSTGKRLDGTGVWKCFDPQTWNAWRDFGNGHRIDFTADFCNNGQLITHYGEQVRAIAEAHASTVSGCYDQWNQLRDAEFIWRYTEVSAGSTDKSDFLKLPQ